MRQRAKWMFVSVCSLPLVGFWPAAAQAQENEAKEKAPM